CANGPLAAAGLDYW
nr:immunoglobulin heavy chain junction region [Macaca mulatta]MOW88153.1 immunoglobulin heavy chain junction region [Macaca mulatta]MOW88641.1 immunoglobulin heavy chain junction region [Macaca mulatta]MOW90532.1 immunoglobulin heavy chain junction region [Macaca mulatta]MOW91094.1 immunoglobulin heavy chain junction region [Macaca mulatta]